MFKYKTDLLLASKTVIAVLISVALTFWWLNPMGMFYTIYTAASIGLMQAGTSRRAQFLAMLFAALSYIALYILGVYFRPNYFLARALLIPFAFIAYYLPNAGLTYRLPPIMGVIVYLVVMMMPMDPFNPGATMLGMAIGSMVAILIYFYLWYYNAEDELLLIMLEITEAYSNAIQVLLSWTHKSRQLAQDKLEAILHFCEGHIASFEQIKAHPEVFKKHAKFFDATEDALYGISKILWVYIDVLPKLSTMNLRVYFPLIRDTNRTLQLQINRLTIAFEHGFFTRRILHRSLGASRNALSMLTRQQNPRPALSLSEFEAALLKIVKPVESKTHKSSEEIASLRLAFGLLRIKELYTDLKIAETNKGK